MKMMRDKSRCRQRGLTMIEVLVTVVILSIGLLGLAALQLTGLRSTSSASYRTQAAILVDDMAERMRTNVTAVNANAFLNINMDSAANYCTGVVIPNPYCGYYDAGSAFNCTANQMAVFDRDTWFCGVNSGGVLTGGVDTLLPGASATIFCTDSDAGVDGDDCTDGSLHTISVSWNELDANRTSGNATAPQTISVTIQP